MLLPRISIVTPSFNQAQFLEATIQSVLDQRYPNLQYGIVDGGSTDASAKIIERYRDHFDYVIIERDQGQSDAINKGLSRSDGAIMSWLNSDDTLLPGALNAIGEIFAARPDCTWLIANSRAVDAENKRLFTVEATGQFNLAGALIRKHTFNIPQPSSYWRRRITDHVGLLNTSYHHCMDLDLWCRFFAAGYAPTVLDAEWSTYRLHADSKSCSQQEQFLRTLMEIEKRYARRLPWLKRLHLYRMIGYQKRAYAIVTEKDRLWRHIMRRPWWLASQQIIKALCSAPGKVSQ